MYTLCRGSCDFETATHGEKRVIIEYQISESDEDAVEEFLLLDPSDDEYGCGQGCRGAVVKGVEHISMGVEHISTIVLVNI